MNIFTRKKALLAEIDDLKSQIQVQSRELANEKTKSGNLKFDLNNMTNEFNKAQSRIEQLMKEKDKENMEMTHHLREITERCTNDEQEILDLRNEIAELHDTTRGLASSVSDLKAKLKAKAAKVTQLTRKLEELKAKDKDKPKTTKP